MYRRQGLATGPRRRCAFSGARGERGRQPCGAGAPGRRIDNRKLQDRRLDLALFPAGKRDCDLRHAEANIFRDPNGAVELVPSAPFFQRVLANYAALSCVLCWELHFETGLGVTWD